MVFLGRLVSWKGADMLLDVFAEVKKQTPSAELWIIGDGPERPRLQRQAEALGICRRGDVPRMGRCRGMSPVALAVRCVFVSERI